MSLGGPPEAQLVLLPARSPAEASDWGSVAMEYAAAFQTVHFARDPATVDWRGYQHVTIVRPDFWPADLPLIIKQANRDITIDRIPVDTPEALQIILHVRVYYGWRYGPQNSFDWAKLWPPGKSLIGLHGRSNGELEGADYAIVRAARLEAVKITTHATPATVDQLRAINPDMFILIRPLAAFTTVDGRPRRVTPQEFYDWTVADLDRLVANDARLRYVEIHNEPNVAVEGLTASWNNGTEFGTWFLNVLSRYRRRYPQLRFGFPGLSPGPTSAVQGRLDSALFLEQAAAAAQQADWIGLHAYWVNEREFSDEALGLGFSRYRKRFPEKLLFITEFGNPQQSKGAVADQYARYYALLRRVPGLGGAFAYVVSTPDAIESPRWAWRDEAGRDLGIAAEIGRRRFIRDDFPAS
ncbi:MAG: hypothetical protein IT318_20615 [Anaerolineales bacterium]|nr:hypothetical protein [Anaerolineales bacterium]